MAAFVGYIVQTNGYHWPWALTGSGITHEQISAAGSPPEQWDALPFEAKAQIIAAIGTFEVIGEYTSILELNGEKHYVRGGVYLDVGCVSGVRIANVQLDGGSKYVREQGPAPPGPSPLRQATGCDGRKRSIS